MVPTRMSFSLSEATPVRRAHWPALLAAAALALTRPQILRAEDRVDYRYEDYSEDNGRIQIQTHAAYVEAELTSRVAVKGQFVYDAISGATISSRAVGRMLQKSTAEMAPIVERNLDRLRKGNE